MTKDNYITDKYLEILKDAYNYYHIIVKDVNEGYSSISYSDQKFAFYVVKHFQNAKEALEYDEKLIINNEFFNSLPFDWYKDYFSKSNYYRIRLRAYRKFIQYLN